MKTPFFVWGLIVAMSLGTVAAQSETKTRPGPEERRLARQKAKERDVARLLREFDENEDDVLDETELPGVLRKYFASLDTDENGKLNHAELLKMRGRPGSKVGEIITGAARGERYEDTLKAGDPAPDFTLADPKGERTVTLSSFQARKPVVLIFGSYT